MPKYRENYTATRQTLREPNCHKAISQIKSIISSHWFDCLTLKEKQQLLVYLQEIERRNKSLDWDKLNEIKEFVSNIYKTYNR